MSLKPNDLVDGKLPKDFENFGEVILRGSENLKLSVKDKKKHSADFHLFEISLEKDRENKQLEKRLKG
jgi:hypothetical protein